MSELRVISAGSLIFYSGFKTGMVRKAYGMVYDEESKSWIPAVTICQDTPHLRQLINKKIILQLDKE